MIGVCEKGHHTVAVGSTDLHCGSSHSSWTNRSRSAAPRSHQVLPLNPCYRCGGKHNPARCRYKEENCHFCGKKGHIARICRRRQQQQQPCSSGSKLHDARYVSVMCETSNSAETRPPAAKPTEAVQSFKHVMKKATGPLFLPNSTNSCSDIASHRIPQQADHLQSC